MKKVTSFLFVKRRPLYLLFAKGCKVLWKPVPVIGARRGHSTEGCKLEPPHAMLRVTLTSVCWPHCLGRLWDSLYQPHTLLLPVWKNTPVNLVIQTPAH